MQHLPLCALLWINDRAEWTDRSGSRIRDVSLIPFHWCLFTLSLVFRFSFESQGERGVDAEQKRLVFRVERVWGFTDVSRVYPFSLHAWLFRGFCSCLAQTSLCYLHLASIRRNRRGELVLNNAYSSAKKLTLLKQRCGWGGCWMRHCAKIRWLASALPAWDPA